MRAFVTGATGFVGTQVVNLLRLEDHSVKVFSRNPHSGHLPEGVETAHGDLADTDAVLDAMQSADVFFHIGEIKNRTRSDSIRNVSLVKAIAGNLVSRGVKRLVFVSAISVAGVPAAIPAEEETPAEIVPKDHYTAYKKEAEEIIRQTLTSEYVILRPAPVYGPGSRYLGRMISLVGLVGPFGIPFLGNAKNIMPLVHVRDLARAIVLAGTRPEAGGQTFTVADGLSHSWRDFLGLVASCQGKSLRIIPIPAVLGILPAPFLDLAAGMFGVAPDLASYTRFFTSDLLFDISKARRMLGWQPEKTDLEAAVREMVDSYRPRPR